jgi:hypothetical protein
MMLSQAKVELLQRIQASEAVMAKLTSSWQVRH